jgi:glycine C-acetyltransferase
MEINFSNASFKDFENIAGKDVTERAEIFNNYLQHLADRGHLNYRLLSLTGCGPEMELITPARPQPSKYISLVSNDYLGFTQHPEIKKAVISGIEKYGTGAGASPAIGGHYQYHEDLERKIAGFFGREAAILYTTGYTANSATLMCLLQKEDIAIVDMAVHASVYEGIMNTTNCKQFLHNRLDVLERMLSEAKDKYRTKLVIIDGVYSQDGDLAPIREILEICRHYNAYLMVDDAHGVGVIGANGRGVLEAEQVLQDVDIISGTLSKTFAGVGGYITGSNDIINFLKYQSRQHLFSVTASPAALGIIRAIELIDDEPVWREQLWNNIHYLKSGLLSMGFNIGATASAIIPVKIGDPVKTGEAGRLLLEAGVYANPIIYPAVSRKNARIRLSIMATHTKEHLDKVLNAFENINRKLQISTNLNFHNYVS